jgi:hypothetical protein
MQHRPLSILLSPGLIILTGCPVEKTYADFIEKYGGTYSSQSASESDGEMVTTSGQGTPTTTAGPGGGAEAGASSGDNGLTTDAGLGSDTSTGTTEPWVDEGPVLGEFVVTPDPVLAAGFIELSADCTDDVGVAELRFLVDGQLLAAVTEPPFAAKWLVKSKDQAGDRTLAVECEDTVGNIVSKDQPVSVTLPATGSVAWSQTYAAIKGNAEAADADAAPDGSWWVCGYADHPVGTTGVWVAHYSAAGEELFTKLISRGKDQAGGCSGIAVASEDGHRAVLTGGFGPKGLWPSLWVGLIDETEVEPIVAESNDALTGAWGNDILVNKYGQFEVAGHQIVAGDDVDMTHQLFNYTPGKSELSTSVGSTYGKPDKLDVASAIVENLDGTVTLVGTLTEDGGAHAAAVKLDAQHSVVTADGWPFRSPIAMQEGAGALDGAVDSQGNIQLTGWWKKTGADPSQMMNLTVDTQGYLVGGMQIETKPKLGDNAGLGVTHLGDGTLIVAASVTSGAEDHDIWLRRYPDDGLIVFKGSYGQYDEPRRVRANALDQILVVGFETVKALQDGKPVPVRRAWLRAFN